ncbi:MAG: hypothetical protein I3275_07325, partial [Candidatus Moeniiplasma glomeromycotorum]|nr:hypothetical protein [Candidatus Moeniiplasma glomeromycotorum]
MVDKVRLKIRTTGDITRAGEVVNIAITAGADGRDFTALIADDNTRVAGDTNGTANGTGDADFHEKTWGTAFKKGAVHSVNLNCGNEETAQEVERLLALKNKVKTGTFLINILGIAYNTTANTSSIGYATNVVTLDANAYSNGNFDIEKNFSIADFAEDNYTNKTEEYTDKITAYNTLINLLKKIKTDYATDLKGKDDIQTDIDKINVYRTAVNTTNEGELKELDYARAGNHKIFEKQLDDWFHFLTEAKKWVEHAGFNKVEQILKANANGFILEGTWNIKNDYSGAEMTYGANCPAAITGAELTAKLIENGKYKGFSITEGTEIKSPAEDNTSLDPANLANKDKRSREIFGKNAKTDKTRYKLFIDKFRANTDPDGFGHDSLKNETDPKKLRGFQPGDITSNDGKSVAVGHNIFDDAVKYLVARDGQYHPHGHANAGDPVNALVEFSQKEMTKKQYDILDLMSGSGNDELDNIIRVAFLENDFEEVEGKTKAEHLQMYWDVIRANVGGGGGNDALFHSNALKLTYNEVKKLQIAQTATSDDQKANVKKLERLENIYEYVREFIDLYFGTAPTTEADFTTWKDKIKKYTDTMAKNADEKAFNIVWSGKIID